MEVHYKLNKISLFIQLATIYKNHLDVAPVIFVANACGGNNILGYVRA